MTELERLRMLVTTWLETDNKKPHATAIRMLDAFEAEVRRDERKLVLATPVQSASEEKP